VHNGALYRLPSLKSHNIWTGTAEMIDRSGQSVSDPFQSFKVLTRYPENGHCILAASQVWHVTAPLHEFHWGQFFDLHHGNCKRPRFRLSKRSRRRRSTTKSPDTSRSAMCLWRIKGKPSSRRVFGLPCVPSECSHRIQVFFRRFRCRSPDGLDVGPYAHRLGCTGRSPTARECAA